MSDHKTEALADALAEFGADRSVAQQMREYLRRHGYFIAYSPGCAAVGAALDEMEKTDGR